MCVKKGKDRFVLVFPTLGIVIKFPIFHFLNILNRIFFDIKNRYWKSLVYVCCKWNPESQNVVSGLLLRGIVANQRERFLWSRTHNPFLQPTIFSFFGLLNIQLYGKPHEGRHMDLWDQVRRITKEEAYSNAHQFSEISNYTLDGGRLRMLDYGGRGSAWIVVKYGKRIVENFDPEFRYSIDKN